jgi:hypothetical protein
VSFVGCVVDPIDAGRSTLHGACFALSPDLVATADHVVEAALERGHESLHVIGPGLEPEPVCAIVRHDEWDVALLRFDRDLFEPFGLAPPLVGSAVTLGAFGSSGRLQARTVVTGLLEEVQAQSTQASRGTADRHLAREPRVVTYSYPAVVMADAPPRAFSGTAVVDADGRAVGLYVLRRGGLGVAVRLDAVVSASVANTARREAA